MSTDPIARATEIYKSGQTSFRVGPRPYREHRFNVGGVLLILRLSRYLSAKQFIGPLNRLKTADEVRATLSIYQAADEAEQARRGVQ